MQGNGAKTQFWKWGHKSTVVHARTQRSGFSPAMGNAITEGRQWLGTVSHDCTEEVQCCQSVGYIASLKSPETGPWECFQGYLQGGRMGNHPPPSLFHETD